MSEQKNRLIMAIAVAAIAVILLGAASFSFFPINPNTPSWPGNYGIVPGKQLPVILIAGDGSVNSTELKQTGDLCTLASDIINQTILVQRDNVVIDGSGNVLDGSVINIDDCSNVTIRNIEFTNASSITLNESSNCLIAENLVPKTPEIISLWLLLENSSNNIISANNLTEANIELEFSQNNTLTKNIITDALSFGVTLSWSSNNTINGNYFTNVLTPIEVDYNQNVVSENNMVNCDQGVRVLGCGNTVFGNNMTFADLGYHVQASDWMTGIVIDGSNNTVYRNIVSGYSLAGISIDGNSETDNGSYYPVYGADVGTGNIFFENIIACNGYGLIVSPDGTAAVDNNTMYHNDFISNNQSVLVCSPDSAEINGGSAYFVNFWDNGSSGNYWSDYAQRYPNASEIGSSGIMSMPNLIDDHNSDMYPLENPYMSENVSDYPNPFAGQTPFPYAIYQVQPFHTDMVAAQNRYSVEVDFYNLPPNVTLQLNPAVPIANVTTTLRMYTFNLAEPSPASTTCTATITFGEGNDTESYSWSFTTSSYS
jgi:parallel beta-helix repeat protein